MGEAGGDKWAEEEKVETKGLSLLRLKTGWSLPGTEPSERASTHWPRSEYPYVCTSKDCAS